MRYKRSWLVKLVGTATLLWQFGGTAWASGLSDTVLAASDAELPVLLAAHKAELTDDFVKDLTQSGLDQASAGKLAEAIRRVERSDAVDTWRRSDHLYRASGQNVLTLFLLQQHRFDEAVQVAQGVAKGHPSLYRPHFLLGTAYFEKRDFDRCIPELKSSIELEPEAEEAHLELAYAYVYIEQPEQARQQFQKVLTIDPDSPAAADGLRVLSEVESHPLPPPANAQASSHFEAGEAAFRSADYNGAVRDYDAALEADPHLSRAAVFKGDAYLQLGLRDDAIASYVRATQINSGDRLAWRYLGDVYERMYDETGKVADLDRAIDAYAHAVRVDPTYETAVDGLARARTKRDLLNQ